MTTQRSPRSAFRLGLIGAAVASLVTLASCGEDNLPTSAAEPRPRPPTPLFLTVKADLTMALGDDPVALGELAAGLDVATKGDNDARIFLRADKTVPYGKVMEVMNLLRAAGYLKVALVGLDRATAP